MARAVRAMTVRRWMAGMANAANMGIRERSFPNATISYFIVGRILAEPAAVSYELMRYVTSAPALPDHHSLAVAQGGPSCCSYQTTAAPRAERRRRHSDGRSRTERPPGSVHTPGA